MKRRNFLGLAAAVPLIAGCKPKPQYVYSPPAPSIIVVQPPVNPEYARFLDEINANSEASLNNDARNRVLSFGINKFVLPMDLNGCENDSADWPVLFAQEYGDLFKTNAMVRCTSEHCHAEQMRAKMDWLLDPSGIKPKDKRVLVISSHGGQTAGPGSETEADELIEFVCPHDFSWEDIRKMITDKELYLRFKAAIEAGADILFLADTCNSGGLDKVVGKKKTKNKAVIPPPEIAKNVRRSKRSKQNRDVVAPTLDMWMGFASKANQTSADTSDDNGRPCGAFSDFGIKTIRIAKKEEPNRAWKSIMRGTNLRLEASGYDQTPQSDGLRADRALFM